MCVASAGQVGKSLTHSKGMPAHLICDLWWDRHYSSGEWRRVARIGHVWFSKKTSPKRTNTGCSWALCGLERSWCCCLHRAWCPGTRRRQEARQDMHWTHCLELRMVNQTASKSQKQKYIVYSLKPKMLYNLETEWMRLCRMRNLEVFVPFINSFPPWWLVGQLDINPL